MHSLYALTRLLYYSCYEDKTTATNTASPATSASSDSNKSIPVEVSPAAVAAGGVAVGGESHTVDKNNVKYTVNKANIGLLR